MTEGVRYNHKITNTINTLITEVFGNELARKVKDIESVSVSVDFVTTDENELRGFSGINEESLRTQIVELERGIIEYEMFAATVQSEKYPVLRERNRKSVDNLGLLQKRLKEAESNYLQPPIKGSVVMRGSKLYSEFARRREIEQIKIEKSAAVDKYFNKWGKITSRYEQWTAPEYYKHAEEVNKKRELDKIKNENLEKRREKLKKLLEDEMKQEVIMMEDLNRPRSKQLSSTMLNNIHETIKRTEEEKRRLELESRLYKKWRNGFCEDSILLDSKSDHEALAKMNWLDKQVAEQLERDHQKERDQERQLRLQKETRKHEEYMMQRKHLRDQEINDLKSFQSKHIAEIKERQEESDKLRCDELKLLQRKQDIAEESEKLYLTSRRRKERVSCSYNLRRIKMLLRQRSDSIRQDLKEDIDMLNRISAGGYENEQIDILKEKFELQYDLEIQKQTQIEAMYESEAKHLLFQQEELWNQEADKREQLLKKLISEQLKNIASDIEYNVKRQRELIEIKEQHLMAIENSSMRLKELLNDQSRDESRSSSRLFLDDVKEKVNARSEQINDLRYSGPKFGRKKIAWT